MKPYLTYRIAPCFVTFTDLQTRRAGLSASTELLIGFLTHLAKILTHFSH